MAVCNAVKRSFAHDAQNAANTLQTQWPPPSTTTHTQQRNTQNAKFAVAPDTLPDGTRVPAGALLLYSAYAVNRARAFWGPDADEFRCGCGARALSPPYHVRERP